MRNDVAAGILVVVLVALVLPASAHQQVDLERYLVIVHEYRTGGADRALASVRSWTESDRRLLELVIADLARHPWPTDIEGRPILLASGMLHSDAAEDAERRGNNAALDFHLEAADRLLQSADRLKGTAVRPRWLLAMGLHLLHQVRIETAQPFLDRACSALPSDARLQLACGMATATYATLLRFTIPTEEEYRQGDNASRKELAVRRDAPIDHLHLLVRRNASLAAAARHFQQAMDADPSLSEARLRLAHIQTITGKDTLAEPTLSGLAAATLPRELAYMARMFLGEIAERRKDLVAATNWYRNAQQSFPRAQSALSALAYVLFASGDRSGSQAVIDEILRGRLEHDEPWARYPTVFLATPADSLDDLRREARR